MAKVPFSKLQASVNNEVVQLYYTNKTGDSISYEVKRYLPIKDKLELVSNIINQSLDTNGFYNPMRVRLYTVLEVVYAYTNLTFTDKMKEDAFKLYDTLVSTGIFEDIVNSIYASDWKEIQDGVWTTIEKIYQYKNSVMGVMENLSTDYSSLNFDLEEIQNNISNPENLTLLKEILNLSGLKS